MLCSERVPPNHLISDGRALLGSKVRTPNGPPGPGSGMVRLAQARECGSSRLLLIMVRTIIDNGLLIIDNGLLFINNGLLVIDNGLLIIDNGLLIIDNGSNSS